MPHTTHPKFRLNGDKHTVRCYPHIFGGNIAFNGYKGPIPDGIDDPVLLSVLSNCQSNRDAQMHPDGPDARFLGESIFKSMQQQINAIIDPALTVIKGKAPAKAPAQGQGTGPTP